MNKRKVKCALAVILSFALFGCGNRTVDYDVEKIELGMEDKTASASNIDFEQNDATDNRTLKEMLNAPEVWKLNCDIGDYLTYYNYTGYEDDEDYIRSKAADRAEINAAIKLPDVGSMSIYSGELYDFSNDYKKKIMEKIFDAEAGIYVYDLENPTKSQIMSQITNLEQELQWYEQQMHWFEDDDLEYIRAEIARLEAMYNSAPDTAALAGDYEAMEYTASIGDYSYKVMFDNSIEGHLMIWSLNSSDNLSFINQDGVKSVSCESYETSFYATLLDSYNVTSYGNALLENECSMTEAEAVRKASDVLARMGFTDFMPEKTANLNWVVAYNELDEYGDYKRDEFANGYVVAFAREVDGINLASDRDEFGAKGGEFSERRINEYALVALTDECIVACEVHNPIKITEVVNNIKLLEFSQIEDAVVENMKAGKVFINPYMINTKTARFNTMNLEYAIMRNGEESQVAILPVWRLAKTTWNDNNREMVEYVTYINAMSGDANSRSW